MITQKEIDRINELSRKSKTPQGLTPEEKAEQKKLRDAYIAAFKASLVANLENTYYIDETGHKRKVNKRNDSKK
ncbi:MAG: DUF896 domain-containing protein [Acutalibacteraceae bacterium]